MRINGAIKNGDDGVETKYFIPGDSVVIPGKAVVVSERDNHGALVGSYNGYYNPKSGTYTLYPRYSPHVWQVKRLAKHVVSERIVRREY